MLVGLVNSGIMTLTQSVGVIMGANIGVKGDLAGIVDKKAKSGFAGHDHEVVSAVQ